MSDYTPTTESVRHAYVDFSDFTAQVAGRLADDALSRAEFDRWIKSVRAEAWDEGYRNGLIYDNPYREA